MMKKGEGGISESEEGRGFGWAWGCGIERSCSCRFGGFDAGVIVD